MDEEIFQDIVKREKLQYIFLKERAVCEVLMVFGKEVEDKIKDLGLLELNYIRDYGLMGWDINKALKHKDIHPCERIRFM